jgi:hypothetical protein
VEKSRVPGVLRQIGVFSVAAGCAQTGVAPLSDTETLVGNDAKDDSAEEEDWEGVFKRLSVDPRPPVRSQAAQAAVAWWPTAGERAFEVIGTLSADESPEVRAAAIRALVTLLESASLRERVEHVCEWATSDEIAKRSAIAAALCAPIPVMVADLAIEQLAHDSEPQIRRAALQAAEARVQEDPQNYLRIARELNTDSDRQVRQAAERLIERVSSIT